MKWKIIILFICCFFLTGCWNYRELNELSISTGMSIDKSEKGFTVGMLISNAQKKEGNTKEGESQTIVLEGTGKTLLEAIKNIGLKSPKEIYFRHLLVVVISEDIAKDGVIDVLDYLLRDSQSRKTFYMILAKDCKAKDTLKILSPLEVFPSHNIATNIRETYRSQAIMTEVTYNSFLKDLLEPGKNPYINTVSIEGNPEKGESQENVSQTEPDTTIKMGTVGIFRNDKLLGWTTKNENRGINILNNKVEMMYTVFNYHNDLIAITLPSMHSKTKVKIEKGEPVIDVSVIGNGLINEVNPDIDLEDQKVIADIEKATEKEVNQYIQEALEITQKTYQSDIFGYGNLIYKNYPKIWQQVKSNWDQDGFSKLKINVKIDITLGNKGSLKQSIKEAKHE